VLQLPGTSAEGIGFRSKGTDGAKVDDVARKFGVEVSFEVGTNLHVVSSAGGSEFGGTGDVVHKPNTASAVNASVHRCLDQGSNVLVLNGTLAAHLVETSPVRTIAHRLILKVTLASLVTNGAIEGVVREKEFHDTLSGLVNERGVGLDVHPWLYGPSTRRDGLGSTLHLDETHTAWLGQ
jgi:hypothetical protein